MPKTEQDRIKRQLNYYFAKNIDSLKSKFYGEDGIWSKYHAFTERFVIEDDEEIHCQRRYGQDDARHGWDDAGRSAEALTAVMKGSVRAGEIVCQPDA